LDASSGRAKADAMPYRPIEPSLMPRPKLNLDDDGKLASEEFEAYA
jgi:hypothetical protein